MKVAVAYIATLLTFVLIDAVWLSRMASVLYKPTMGDMLLDQFRVAPAVVFYLMFAAGLVYFAVWPGLDAGSWRVALVHGALIGAMAYATYDLTNHATLRNWSTTMTVVDIIWGATLSALSAVSGYLAASYFAR
ncbi:MAG: DUF2177 family protein [Hyphomicrobiaceae bacterium]